MIVPAILTDDKDAFQMMLRSCIDFTDFVQIDIMDGKFVPSRSITVEELKSIRSPIRSEAHLMVNDPVEWIIPFKEFGSERLIVHFEIPHDMQEIIRKIKDEGLHAGLAVNPDTKLSDFAQLVNEVDMVLFMSVVPGFYGARFIPQVLDKVKEFKKRFPDTLTGIDGGMKLDNVHLARQAGIDNICVGSAILQAESPKEAFKKFSKV